MTQDAGRRPSKRSARSGRNRPTLVTSTENTTSPTDAQNEQVLEEENSTLEESPAEVQAQNPPVSSSKPRLPRFFSTVGKSTQAETPSEKDKDTAAQARLARATRNKLASPSAKTTDTSGTEKQSEQKAEVRKVPARTSSSTRSQPASPFKTRYFIGMALYLLAANFIGAFETSFLNANHLDSLLAQFSLFGLPIVIRTSTLVFLATLVIILVLLARLDLIPRNFSAITGQASSQQNRRSSTTSTSENVRNTPPAMKQGVKGADDALYQKYRSKQRRERKK